MKVPYNGEPTELWYRTDAWSVCRVRVVRATASRVTVLLDADTAATQHRITDYSCYFKTLPEVKAHMLAKCRERIRKCTHEAAQLREEAKRAAARMPAIRQLTDAGIRTESLAPARLTEEML